MAFECPEYVEEVHGHATDEQRNLLHNLPRQCGLVGVHRNCGIGNPMGSCQSVLVMIHGAWNCLAEGIIVLLPNVCPLLDPNAVNRIMMGEEGDDPN